MSKKTHFGFSDIDTTDKTKKVGEVFNSVATKYDLMNDLMSFGLHRFWKKFFVQTANLKKKAKILDIAGGSGDLSIGFAKQNKEYEIFHTDINQSMLQEGQKKIINSGHLIPSIVCDAETLPFSDSFFDCVVIGFGLRNMTDKEKALKEIWRVLSPGGKILILEFSKVWRPLEKIYDIFSFNLIPRIGKLITKDEGSYQYLVESIRVHPSQDELKKMMENCGFKKVSFNNLSAGVVAIHSGFKT